MRSSPKGKILKFGALFWISLGGGISVQTPRDSLTTGQLYRYIPRCVPKVQTTCVRQRAHKVIPWKKLLQYLYEIQSLSQILY